MNKAELGKKLNAIVDDFAYQQQHRIKSFPELTENQKLLHNLLNQSYSQELKTLCAEILKYLD